MQKNQEDKIWQLYIYIYVHIYRSQFELSIEMNDYNNYNL